MRAFPIVLGFVAAVFFAQTLQAQSWVPTAPGAEPETAIDGAKAWLSLNDHDNTDQSWSQSSAYFQSHVSRAELAATVKQVRYDFGPAIYRSFVHGEQRDALPDAPAGQYLVLHFRTEGSRHVTRETVTMLKHDGAWQVTGYYASGPNGTLTGHGVGALPMRWN